MRNQVSFLLISNPLLFLNCFFRDYICGDVYREDVEATDKVAIVTGANTGIGKETAWELARRGAKVYMACRDMKRCENVNQNVFKTLTEYMIF